MTTELTVPVQNDLTRLRTLSLEEIEQAFLNHALICGFYIRAFDIRYEMLCNITIHHKATGTEIKLDAQGNVSIV